jgi:hypothetical protein
MNPPFDVRINYKKQQQTFLLQLHDKIAALGAKQSVLLLPDTQSHFLQNHDSHWKKIFGFSHGGLKVQAITYISTT